MNTKDYGEICELEVMLAFKKLGIPVLIPYGDNLRFDLVILLNDKFYKIQVKKGHSSKNGCLIFRTCSYTYGWGKKGGKKTGYEGEIDFFAVCYKNNIYLVGISEARASGSMTLRIDPPKHPNKNINWAKDYALAVQVNKLMEP